MTTPKPHGSSSTNNSIIITTQAAKWNATVLKVLRVPTRNSTIDTAAPAPIFTTTPTPVVLLFPEMLAEGEGARAARGGHLEALGGAVALRPLTVVLEAVPSLTVAIYVEDRSAKLAGLGLLDDGAEGFVPVGRIGGFVGLFFSFFAFFLFVL